MTSPDARGEKEPPTPDRTIDVGYVHVGVYGRPSGMWMCVATCPHPAHRAENPPSIEGEEVSDGTA